MIFNGSIKPSAPANGPLRGVESKSMRARRFAQRTMSAEQVDIAVREFLATGRSVTKCAAAYAVSSTQYHR
jgi:hypothetical protein